MMIFFFIYKILLFISSQFLIFTVLWNCLISIEKNIVKSSFEIFKFPLSQYNNFLTKDSKKTQYQFKWILKLSSHSLSNFNNAKKSHPTVTFNLIQVLKSSSINQISLIFKHRLLDLLELLTKMVSIVANWQLKETSLKVPQKVFFYLFQGYFMTKIFHPNVS